MEKLILLCVEDQREVLNTVVTQLSALKGSVVVESCESGEEALEVMDEADNEGDHIALVISDHVMPEMTGVELFMKMSEDGRFKEAKRILLTGQATHEDTIEAINKGDIDFYVSKPWEEANLKQKVNQLLTEYVLEKGLEYSSDSPFIDQKTLLNHLHKR